MRAFFTILGLAANILFFSHVYAAPHLVQTHNIDIVVDSVDDALEAIRRLGGHNLQMYMSTVERYGMTPVRQAEIIRRVDASEYRRAQEILRSLGTVTSEGESARNVGGEISDLQLRIQAATGEFDRISYMLMVSDTIEMLIALDTRLSEIAWQRDNLVGALNVLMAESGSAVITIHLAEDMGVFVPLPGPSFGERVSGSFFGSWNVVVRIAEGLAIFIAYAFIPSIILTLLFFPLRAAYKVVNRNREKLRILAWQKYYAANTKAAPSVGSVPANNKTSHAEIGTDSAVKDESSAMSLVSPAHAENVSEHSSVEKSKLLEVQDV